MQCDSCSNEAVISQQYSGRHLCYRHHAADLEAKAKRSIRAHHWLVSGDKIGVVVTGDKRSSALLHFMKKLTEHRRDICLSVIPEDGCSGDSMSTVIQIATNFNIACMELLPTSSGSTFQAKNIQECSDDTTFTNQPWRETVSMAAFTKIAVAVTLEDIASGTLAMFLRGSLEALPQAIAEESRAIPVMSPFSTIPAPEVEIYWDGLGYEIECPPSSRIPDIFNDRVRTLLEDYNTRHPATNHALLNLGEQLTGGKGVLLAEIRGGDPVPGGIHGMCRLLREENGNVT